MTIELFPPHYAAPFKRFKLTSTGREVAPNFAKGGVVVVHSVDEELELLSEGWTRTAGKLDAGDLRKAAHACLTLSDRIDLPLHHLRRIGDHCAAMHQRGPRD